MSTVQNPGNLREITREIVSGVILSSDGKLLMGKKDPKKGGVYGEVWVIPGGGVEPGEDKLTTLRREILEETNIVIGDAVIELADDSGRGASEKTLKETGERVWCYMNFTTYSVKLTQAADQVVLVPTEELIELKWFEIGELSGVQLAPPSIELFTRLGYLQAQPIKPWKVLSKKDVSPSKWFPVEQHTVELPGGAILDDYFVSVLNPVAMVIAVTKEHKIVFVQQYKHGIGEVMTELPAGFARNDQSPEQAAVAELEEETGIKVEQKTIIPLGKIAVHPSKSKCVVHGFLIKEVEFNSKQNLDITEQINVVQLSAEEAFAAIKSGEIWAVDTVAFLFKAKELL